MAGGSSPDAVASRRTSTKTARRSALKLQWNARTCGSRSAASMRAGMNIRVADINATYEEWRAKGATFLTPPMDRGAEIRCYLRDPDGHLIELGQATGMLERMRRGAI